ncbi:hypothetical protein CNMCM5623_001265 [Aspergillus felis]|uniref:Beta-lactamase-like ARB-00930-like C-terminal domain-containing protein n=1 Tax=Aspergillus felis TaxID=1287682 RepID=A0A8H6Q6S0_9EURO|nr:hypothetical protein CNMCM5623_001265 [Aspergillus felis]
MDRPKVSEEAAPAYHELFDTESINQPAATSSRTHQYAAVPHTDLDENANTASHHDVESHPQESGHPLVQLDPTKPHFHCETCDRQLERRERREKENQPDVEPQQAAQPNPPVKEGERDRVEDSVGEERKLMQEGDTYAGLIALLTQSNATSLLADLVTEAILPALIEQAASAAKRNFAVKYTIARWHSSLARAVSASGNPGLSVTSWVSNGTDLMPLLGQRMPIPKHILHPSSGSLIIRAPVERDDAPEPAVLIAAVARPVADIVHPVPDVLVVALQAIREVDVECFKRAVAPGVVIWHTGPAKVDPGAVAGGLVWFAPATGAGAEAAVGVDVSLVVHTVEAVGAVVPLEVVYGPGG